MARSGLIERIRLTPEGVDVADARRLVHALSSEKQLSFFLGEMGGPGYRYRHLCAFNGDEGGACRFSGYIRRGRTAA
jgi:hypothetical protein